MKNKEIKVLKLIGTPYERGIAHGEELRKDIQSHMELWAENTEKELNMSVKDYLKRLYTKTDFLPAICRYAPDILDEVRGIAAGANLPFDVVLARQLSDEEPWFRNTIKYGLDIGSNCTSVGIKGKGSRQNIIAQNMDCPKYYDGYQLVLDIKEHDSDLEYKIFTVTGKVSLCGMNNYGVGITCNTVLQLNFSTRGLAEDFVVRKSLQCKSYEEMINFLNSVPHASGQNYLLGGPTDIVSLECSGNKKVVATKSHKNGRYYHTNHNVNNDDTSIFDEALLLLRKRDEELYNNIQARFKKDTYRRFEFAKDMMISLGDLSVEGIKAVLASHDAPLCKHGEDQSNNFTLGSIVMELDRNNPKMHVTCGPSCCNPYQEFSFEKK